MCVDITFEQSRLNAKHNSLKDIKDKVLAFTQVKITHHLESPNKSIVTNNFKGSTMINLLVHEI